jgi:hypothetical protein
MLNIPFKSIILLVQINIVDTFNTDSGTPDLDISFRNMFQAKYKIIIIVIITIMVITIAVIVLIMYCNRTKIDVAVAWVSAI